MTYMVMNCEMEWMGGRMLVAYFKEESLWRIKQNDGSLSLDIWCSCWFEMGTSQRQVKCTTTVSYSVSMCRQGLYCKYENPQNLLHVSHSYSYSINKTLTATKK